MLKKIRSFIVSALSGILADVVERLKPETRKKIFINFLMKDLWLMDGNPLNEEEKCWLAGRISDLFDAEIGLRQFMKEASEKLEEKKFTC